MNKKIMIGSILAVLMLVAISFSAAAAAVSSQSNDVEKKKNVSPLFGIRTKGAIGEKISSFKARFLDGRVFLAFSFLKIFKIGSQGWTDTYPRPTACNPTCLKCDID